MGTRREDGGSAGFPLDDGGGSASIFRAASRPDRRASWSRGRRPTHRFARRAYAWASQRALPVSTSASTIRAWRPRRLRTSLSLAQSLDRKSTRLNSSHTVISYAVFCLKKKKQQ